MPREYPRFQTNIPEKIAHPQHIWSGKIETQCIQEALSGHPQRAAYPSSATAACASAGLRKR
jgi:hypothetical protein